MPVPDDVWSAFATAGFTCWDGPQRIVVRPAPPGTASGPFPFDQPVAFLTADNPQGRVVTEVENAHRRVDLADVLEELGLAWLPAVGGDPEGDHLEPGAVVLGLDTSSAARLGARFDQAAVYLWEPRALHLVACASARHDVLGYDAVSGPAAAL